MAFKTKRGIDLVLFLREERERAAARTLAGAEGRLAIVSEIEGETRALVEKSRATGSGVYRLEGSCSAGQMTTVQEASARLFAVMNEQGTWVEKMQYDVDRAKSVFNTAHQDRKLIERVAEKRTERRNAERAEGERREIDEVALSRYAKRIISEHTRERVA